MSWWDRSTPYGIKPIPWLHPRVIERLESLLTKESRVLEHGGGGSTLWFAERVKFLATYENDLDWYRAIQSYLKGKSNFYISTNEEPPIMFHPYLTWDLIFIDGEPIEKRSIWIDAAYDLIKPGGWIILDNANRPEYSKERSLLQKACDFYQTFDCNEGTQYLVTEFYRMKG